MPDHRDAPEGQRHHEEKVRDGQVQQIHLSHLPTRHVPEQDHQKKEVPAEAQHKDQAVEDWQEDFAEGQHLVLPTEQEGHLIQVVLVVVEGAVIGIDGLSGEQQRGGSGGHFGRTRPSWVSVGQRAAGEK